MNLIVRTLLSIIIKISTIFSDNIGEIDLSKYFRDTHVKTTDTHIIKKRKQIIGDRIFVVRSFFDRFATETAEDKLRSLITMEAEKEVRETVRF